MKCHTGIRPFPCSECPKSFVNRYNLKAHQLVHTKEKNFVCAQCGKSFSYNISLKSHLEKIHSEDNVARLSNGQPIIDAQSIVKVQPITETSDMKNHIGVRPFSCSNCSKSFQSRSNLTAHQRVHTKEKNYVCAECGKSFSYNLSLKLHTKRVHSEDIVAKTSKKRRQRKKK